MPEEIQDVQATSSIATEEVVKESVESTEQEATPVENDQQTAQSAVPEAVKDEGEVDEKGVPYKNRYMEAQRKLQSIEQKYVGLESNLPNIIQEAVAKAIPQKEAAPTYSKEELIKFKNTTDNPEHRAWAEIELEKIRSKETEEYFKSQTQAREKQLALESERRSTLENVRKNYSIMFNPDGTFNESSPLTQRAFRILNSDAALMNHPRGLQAATEMAFAQHILETQPQMANRENKLKRQVKKLQNATLVEGNGQPQTVKKVDHLGNAIQRLSKSGDKDSAKAVAAELIKSVHAGLV